MTECIDTIFANSSKVSPINLDHRVRGGFPAQFRLATDGRRGDSGLSPPEL